MSFIYLESTFHFLILRFENIMSLWKTLINLSSISGMVAIDE
ncbi:hypothetical protein DYY67_1884 [Candidatus Nitrosotalea sp. TS]|nr:hypothetical protein [Candidatus Nitrosotalea sp. TS]